MRIAATRSGSSGRGRACLTRRLALFVGIACGPSAALASERYSRPDGTEVEGRILGDAATGLRFVATDDGSAIPLMAGGTIRFDPVEDLDPVGTAPLRVRLGFGGRISGRLERYEGDHLVFLPSGSESSLRIPKSALMRLEQPAGSSRVFQEDFNELDPDRWQLRVGEVGIDPEGGLSGGGGLRLPSASSTIGRRFSEPLTAGRVELAYLESGETHPGRHWFVDFGFLDKSGEIAPVRVVLGWASESYVVLSPKGPRLQVQRLSKTAGWHRLAVDFAPDSLVVAVDGSALAFGPGQGGPVGERKSGPSGPLVEVRLATSEDPGQPPRNDLAARVDDLSVFRSVAVADSTEEAPERDGIRLVNGDQVFGPIVRLDSSGVTIRVAGRPSAFDWPEVAEVTFGRVPDVAAPVTGWIIEATWRPGRTSDDLDRVEGALVSASETGLVVDVPYLGELTIPRDRLDEVRLRDRAERIVIDPYPRHLGDRYVPDLEPRRPEDEPYDLGFSIEEASRSQVRLAFDVVQLIGQAGTPQLSEAVRRGEYRTKVFLNGQRLTDLNEEIDTLNLRTERIFIEVPDGLLRAGPNRLRLEQVGAKGNLSDLDNFGLLGVAIESKIPDEAGEAGRP